MGSYSACFSDFDENIGPNTNVINISDLHAHPLDKYDPVKSIRQYKKVVPRSKPICYDPTLYQLEDKNTAPKGSLLKVWEGQFECSKKNDPIKC
jgi:hypothetical protein